ncbi:MAG: hypothetical protein J0I79_20905 [Mesorhizobium sp.]|uniref:hypothetical protein n=1 Tax=Mesorhizobium sp. TaxID=1871066 RepID=UPI001AD3C873|nr:hypothetical protein [Mesorhizobium sp.]MBN9220415.1 hypothetical protein [Mesorhizobium sp.]
MTSHHAEQLGRARTAADFAAAIALLETDLNDAIARKRTTSSPSQARPARPERTAASKPAN